MADWRELLHSLHRSGTPHVLVTVVEALGSTPREAGAKMVVTTEGLATGSIGGGSLENAALATAARLLAEGAGGPILEKTILGPDHNQCCGGAVTLLFEPFAPPPLVLALFGAGHVARALVRVLDGIPCRVIWVDERAEAFPDALPNWVEQRLAPEPDAEVPTLPPGCHALVMTHSHTRDYALALALLGRDDLASVGVIGSATKAARFRKRLREDGVAAERVESLRCPLGLPGLSGKHPAEIAVAVVAQLLRKEE